MSPVASLPKPPPVGLLLAPDERTRAVVIAEMTDERIELNDLVRRFAADRAPLSQTRALMTDGRYDAAVWQRMGEELGLPALAVPERFGGLGCGPVELAIAAEQLGGELYGGPYLSTVCLAIPALLAVGTEEQLADILEPLLTGRSTAALAYAEPGGSWAGAGIAGTHAEVVGGRTLVSGTKTLVVDGDTAEILVVTAASTADPSALTFLVVRADAPGVTRRSLPTFDQTRQLAQIVFDRAEAQVLGDGRDHSAQLSRVLQQACLLLAAEQLGGARRCLEMAVDYARSRTQFGRAIGSFQAIKHRCADTLLDVETARSAVLLGLAAAESGEPLDEMSSLVRSHCSEVFTRAAATNVQVHGGIGFTWEHDAHLYLKRARSSAALLGTVAEHRELLATAIGL